ncbi:MAG: tol-pal system-associated acyl-CoA thioesterase [Rhodocyclaceae bacterium]|nr:tol-pal system-associated acyl-CoA thioesterase [Rhodocyclaceae bacterium]MBX3669056.1 tol-pal system-associated acyl-CoA thioesterase [Rhodocyclaceae bacterium]
MSAAPTPANGPSPASFRYTVRVYYEDTDAGAVVYYANYLKFCERARTEWLRQCGVEQKTLLDERGIAFMVRRLKAEFVAPARLDDALDVSTQVARLAGASVVFAQRIARAGQLLFECEVVVACVNHARGRPMPIPPDLRACFSHP